MWLFHAENRELYQALSLSTLSWHIVSLDCMTAIYVEDTRLRLMVLKEEVEAICHQMTIIITDHHHTTPEGTSNMALKQNIVIERLTHSQDEYSIVGF